VACPAICVRQLVVQNRDQRLPSYYRTIVSMVAKHCTPTRETYWIGNQNNDTLGEKVGNCLTNLGAKLLHKMRLTLRLMIWLLIGRHRGRSHRSIDHYFRVSTVDTTPPGRQFTGTTEERFGCV